MADKSGPPWSAPGSPFSQPHVRESTAGAHGWSCPGCPGHHRPRGLLVGAGWGALTAMSLRACVGPLCPRLVAAFPLHVPVGWATLTAPRGPRRARPGQQGLIWVLGSCEVGWGFLGAPLSVSLLPQPGPIPSEQPTHGTQLFLLAEELEGRGALGIRVPRAASGGGGRGVSPSPGRCYVPRAPRLPETPALGAWCSPAPPCQLVSAPLVPRFRPLTWS